MMSQAAKVQRLRDVVSSIPMQPASEDIWDTKYRLKTKDGVAIDQTVDASYQRVARALAEVEAPELRETWYEKFLWALRHGAGPTGTTRTRAHTSEEHTSELQSRPHLACPLLREKKTTLPWPRVA